LPAGRVLYLLRQVCDALRMAHRLGLVHRDLKPSNLFLTRKGDSYDVIKVLDFGLVHDSQHALGGATLTRHGAIMGTPGYMPPEQTEGVKRIDPRSDIYSLGAVGYFLLTGRPPYQGNSVAEILVAQMMTDPPPLTAVQPPVPADVIALVNRCLARHPEDRFNCVDQVLAAIDSCASVTEWSASMAESWHLAQHPETTPRPPLVPPLDSTRTLPPTRAESEGPITQPEGNFRHSQ
jgi:serine/threonine-protein kinase